mmetsp:Transcript_19236/g.34020  ORF Transcript_19236/g.34020 Transcript_19236/m.34020 type:complete len:217 (-) Transcript_19236:1296-1946(-)
MSRTPAASNRCRRPCGRWQTCSGSSPTAAVTSSAKSRTSSSMTTTPNSWQRSHSFGRGMPGLCSRERHSRRSSSAPWTPMRRSIVLWNAHRARSLRSTNRTAISVPCPAHSRVAAPCSRRATSSTMTGSVPTSRSNAARAALKRCHATGWTSTVAAPAHTRWCSARLVPWAAMRQCCKECTTSICNSSWYSTSCRQGTQWMARANFFTTTQSKSRR